MAQQELPQKIMGIIKAATEDENPPRTPPLDTLAAALYIFFSDEQAHHDVLDLVISHIYRVQLEQAKHLVRETRKSDGIHHGRDPRDLIKQALPHRLPEKTKRTLSENLYEAASKALLPREKLKRSGYSASSHCYMCGDSITHQNDEQIRDHIVPKACGGSNSKSNIAMAHARCEATKGATIGPCDTAVFGLSSTTIPPTLKDPPSQAWPINIDNKNAHHRHNTETTERAIRTSILQRQGYRCIDCNSAYAPSRTPLARRRDTSIPWTYSNTEFTCSTCHANDPPRAHATR